MWKQINPCIMYTKQIVPTALFFDKRVLALGKAVTRGRSGHAMHFARCRKFIGQNGRKVFAVPLCRQKINA